jgi:hypothetical protein
MVEGAIREGDASALAHSNRLLVAVPPAAPQGLTSDGSTPTTAPGSFRRLAKWPARS